MQMWVRARRFARMCSTVSRDHERRRRAMAAGAARTRTRAPRSCRRGSCLPPAAIPACAPWRRPHSVHMYALYIHAATPHRVFMLRVWRWTKWCPYCPDAESCWGQAASCAQHAFQRRGVWRPRTRRRMCDSTCVLSAGACICDARGCDAGVLPHTPPAPGPPGACFCAAVRPCTCAEMSGSVGSLEGGQERRSGCKPSVSCGDPALRRCAN